jgi:hypothetical protein
MTMEGITQEIIDAARKMIEAQPGKSGHKPLDWGLALGYALDMKRLSQGDNCDAAVRAILDKQAGRLDAHPSPREIQGYIPAGNIIHSTHATEPCKSCGMVIGHTEECQVWRK